jgi:hypothetical protein
MVAVTSKPLTRDDLRLLAFCGRPRSASEIKAAGFQQLLDAGRVYSLVSEGRLSRRLIPLEDRQRALRPLYLYQRVSK